ncbi:hypothetical protein D3C87_200590 [compost metagenome]
MRKSFSDNPIKPMCPMVSMWFKLTLKILLVFWSFLFRLESIKKGFAKECTYIKPMSLCGLIPKKSQFHNISDSLRFSNS